MGVDSHPSTKAQALAVVTGAVLSGAMISLSLVAVPVFLDTTSQPSQLFHQWARIYHYGHQALPALAVTTFLLYLYTALKKRARKRSWAVFAAAGTTTLTMIPFTWIVMVPTNNTLFRLEADSKLAPVSSWDEAQQLVTAWSRMHLLRSLFPLAGAALGATGILNERVR